MESNIKFEMPKKQLFDKKRYEPFLRETLNNIPYFIEKSKGGFSAPISEHECQCDAIGNGSCYNIDFKLLISQEGAQNVNETSLTEIPLTKGVVMSAPSKASMHGKLYLPFPNVWGFLVSHSLTLTPQYELILVDKADKYMKQTLKSLNRMLRVKKNIVVFNPCRLFVDGANVNQHMDVISNKAQEALSIISEVRRTFSQGYETYYALMVNHDIILLSEYFAYVGSVKLASLKSWNNL